jgi:hypothetical protein
MKGQKYQQQAAIRVTSRIRASLLARAFTRQVRIGSLGDVELVSRVEQLRRSIGQGLVSR